MRKDYNGNKMLMKRMGRTIFDTSKDSCPMGLQDFRLFPKNELVKMRLKNHSTLNNNFGPLICKLIIFNFLKYNILFYSFNV